MTADQSNTVQNANLTFGKSSTTTIDVAQSFQVSADNQINKVSFYIKKFGTPSNVTVRILADNNGVPSKTVLASGTLNASQVTANYSWVDVNLGSPPPVFTNHTYWVSIDAGYDALRYWIMGLDNLNSYAAGKAMSSVNWNATSPVWTDAGGDFDFKIWLGGLTTEIATVKVGGDARAHHIEGVNVGRDAYAEQITMASYVGRDARAALIDDSTVIRDAYSTTTTGTTVGGNQYPGEAQADPAPIGMPISDGQIQDWKDAAAIGDPVGPISLSGNDQITIGPQKINGSVSLSNWAEIHVTGPIWITGNLNLSNFTKFIIDPSLGAQGTVVIVDGTISVGNDAEINGSGTDGSYLLAVSTKSGSAIDVANGTAAVILYAPYGSVTLVNAVAVNEVTAYKLILSNFASVTYEHGLASATFSSGPGGSWVLKKGTWQEL